MPGGLISVVPDTKPRCGEIAATEAVVLSGVQRPGSSGSSLPRSET